MITGKFEVMAVINIQCTQNEAFDWGFIQNMWPLENFNFCAVPGNIREINI